jgi:hypothetical protein
MLVLDRLAVVKPRLSLSSVLKKAPRLVALKMLGELNFV